MKTGLHLSRRQLLCGGVAAAATATGVGVWAQSAEPRVIAVVAKRFAYMPNVIPVKLGEKVVLAVTSLDFVHGLNIPDLGIRADLVPGRVTRVELTANKLGNIDFVCDNFCGDHHEEMHGSLVVTA